jgi:hypothetical protein
MPETDTNDAVKREVERALGILTMSVVQAAGGAIHAEAFMYWEGHYGPKFKKVIEGGRRFDTDRVNLEERAQALGAEARRRAEDGTISRMHAEQASDVVDCKGIGPFHYWCA